MPLIDEKLTKFEFMVEPETPGRSDIYATKHRLVKDDHSLTLYYEALWKGLSKNGKPWSRWAFRGLDRIIREPDGRFVSRALFAHHGSMTSRMDGALRLWSHRPEHVSAFIGKVHPRDLFLYYPGAPERPNRVERAYQTDDRKKAISELFGKTRYRRPLAGLLDTVTPATMATISHWAGLVPIDHIVNFLARTPQIEGGDTYSVFYVNRKFMRAIPPVVILRLLRSDDYRNAHLFDAYRWVRFAGGVPPADFRWDEIRNWRNLHDRIVQTKHKPRENRQIPQSADAQRIDGLTTAGGLTIRTPKETHDLVGWGDYTSTCIAGYDDVAISGSSLLGSAWRDDQLIALFEIRNNLIVQLVGRFNAALPPEVDRDIRTALASAITIHPF